ncbi:MULTISPECIES: beta barrel domain-containing protein [Priestia]|uniref:beta barrel domain-containing protein n=1 Tax=Priestia TaxID=2800373 RepID=UPI0011299684|nr:hypothetical protein [Priestia megaterium]TPF18019.1 hypothetical protein CBE78_01985 [Priestia megaterium]TPF22126.1 hypothetical protein CBE79_04490 [Priestia megaterium]
MKKIEVGQIVYVHSQGFISNSKEELTEYKVTKVNGTSFYAKPDGFKHEERFSHKTMRANSIGEVLTAYTDPQVFWNAASVRDEKRKLKNEIEETLPYLNLETLKKIKEILR